MTFAVPSALQTHLDSGTTTLGWLLKITRTDGAVFGFTSAGQDVTISGTLYSAAQGLTISSLTGSAGFGVDTLEMTTIDDGSLFTRAQVLGGIWQNAAWVLSRYNWASPSDGVLPEKAGTIGHVGLRAGSIVLEFRCLRQYLQQEIGNVTQRTCRARFADYPTQQGSNRCGLTAATYISTGTVSAVTSKQVFESSGLWTAVPTDDYFGEGLLKMTSGACAGMSMKVKSYTTGGVLTLMLPLVDSVANGDTFEIIAGCRKRLTEDCKTKFGNVPNFQGEPHLPGVDALTAVPEASA